jgi:hypothetical protein
LRQPPHHDAIKKLSMTLPNPSVDGWCWNQNPHFFFTIVGLLCRHVTGLP